MRELQLFVTVLYASMASLAGMFLPWLGVVIILSRYLPPCLPNSLHRGAAARCSTHHFLPRPFLVLLQLGVHCRARHRGLAVSRTLPDAGGQPLYIHPLDRVLHFHNLNHGTLPLHLQQAPTADCVHLLTPCRVASAQVGYGDVFPVTAWGKVAVTPTLMLGSLMLAMPLSVLAARFVALQRVEDAARHAEAGTHGNVLPASKRLATMMKAIRNRSGMCPEGAPLTFGAVACLFVCLCFGVWF